MKGQSSQKAQSLDHKLETLFVKVVADESREDVWMQ